ncbi:PASTA domain-containing protein [Flindersiella endophytica]
MDAERRSIGGALVLVAVVAVLIWAPAARSSVLQPVTLTLSPVDGRIGTTVTASGSCVELRKATGSTDEVVEHDVKIYWGGDREVAGTRVNGQTYEYVTTFVVPTDAIPNVYSVTAVCDKIEASSEFTVTLPDNPTTDAPTTPSQATATSSRRKSRSQPGLVGVPSLAGKTISAASALLGGDLVLGRVTGTGDLIQRQNPAAGTMVRVGSAVNVSLTTLPAQDLVAVPDLVNKSLADARSVVPTARLVLEDDPGGEGTIVSQSPVTGTLVPPGSAITAVLATESLSLVERTTRFGLGVLALVAAGLLLLRLVGRRGPRWRTTT